MDITNEGSRGPIYLNEWFHMGEHSVRRDDFRTLAFNTPTGVWLAFRGAHGSGADTDFIAGEYWDNDYRILRARRQDDTVTTTSELKEFKEVWEVRVADLVDKGIREELDDIEHHAEMTRKYHNDGTLSNDNVYQAFMKHVNRIRAMLNKTK